MVWRRDLTIGTGSGREIIVGKRHTLSANSPERRAYLKLSVSARADIDWGLLTAGSLSAENLEV